MSVNAKKCNKFCVRETFLYENPTFSYFLFDERKDKPIISRSRGRAPEHSRSSPSALQNNPQNKPRNCTPRESCRASLRHRIISASAPWVAADYSFEADPESFEGTILPECLQCVLGAGRCETTGWGSERGDAELVEFYQQYKRSSDDALY